MALTRADAIEYYKAISRTILPHLRNRPISFKRFVDTIHGEFFWEKDAPGFTPPWVKRVPVPRRGKGGDDIDYIVVNDARTLNWIVSVGGFELHPFLHVAPRIDLATQVVFDLDPGEGADIHDCARVALLLRDALRSIRLESFAKVSGSKGIQVYVPIKPAPHDFTEAFARLVANELARAHPKLIVSEMSKVLRRNKVLIDWSQNADYKTTIGVYSLRATGLVSMPIRWDEMRRPPSFDPAKAIARVKRAGDLFEPVLKLNQKLPGSTPHPASGHPLPARRGEGLGVKDLPKPRSQSGRRLFVLTNDELWLDMNGMFKRWILRANGATFAGDLPIDLAYYRGELPSKDSGAYEVIEGSFERQWFRLWFSGRVLQGEWTLEKIEKSDEHRSWRLAPKRG